MIRRGWLSEADRQILLPVLALMAVSIFNLYSASQQGQAGSPHVAQLASYGVGFAVLVVASLVGLPTLERYAYLYYGLLLVPLALVHVIGRKVAGAQSWIHLGPLHFQPSEPMKLALLLALARFFNRTRHDPPFDLIKLAQPFLLLGVPLLLILKEPDMGTAIVYLSVTGSIFLFAGIERRTLLTALGSAGALVGILWYWKGDPLFFLKAHQRARLATFLDPESDPLGVGYHVIQSKIAIGSGGWWGRGYLKGLQTQFSFLPEQHTDFAFSVFAEEMGFFWSVVVLFLFAWIIVRAFAIARQARDPFGCVLAAGVGLLFFWHVLINIGMITGLLPVIGVPLPFLSYGGSSAVTLMAAVGLLLNVHRSRHLF
ncbi:MAG: rod shape-determining protein RodA [Bdellovibrionota bacterium]